MSKTTMTVAQARAMVRLDVHCVGGKRLPLWIRVLAAQVST